MKKIILSILLVSLPIKVYCEPALISGAGTAKCSEYNSVPSEQQETVFFTWMQGFLTASNIVNRHDSHFYIDLGNSNYNNVYQKGLLDMLCQQNPNEEVYLQGLKILIQLQRIGLTVRASD